MLIGWTVLVRTYEVQSIFLRERKEVGCAFVVTLLVPKIICKGPHLYKFLKSKNQDNPKLVPTKGSRDDYVFTLTANDVESSTIFQGWNTGAGGDTGDNK